MTILFKTTYDDGFREVKRVHFNRKTIDVSQCRVIDDVNTIDKIFGGCKIVYVPEKHIIYWETTCKKYTCFEIREKVSDVEVEEL